MKYIIFVIYSKLCFHYTIKKQFKKALKTILSIVEHLHFDWSFLLFQELSYLWEVNISNWQKIRHQHSRYLRTCKNTFKDKEMPKSFHFLFLFSIAMK